MSPGRRILAGLAVAAALALGAAQGPLRAQDGVYRVGDTVESISAADISGEAVALGDLKGKVAVINFFSLR